MNFLNGITNLTNWMGNVIMPTVAGLFFALAVVRYARGYPHQYIAWSGLMCLMVSGLLRGLETFASQSAWNNPDTIWITLRGLVNWSVQRVPACLCRLADCPGRALVRGSRPPYLPRKPLDQTFCRGGNGAVPFRPVAARGVLCPERHRGNQLRRPIKSGNWRQQ